MRRASPSITLLLAWIALYPLQNNVSALAAVNKDCVIVGGGPVGLACALTLSQDPHGYRVTVLEQTTGDTSVREYNPARSYLYNINQRGLSWFQQPSNEFAMQQLQDLGFTSGESQTAICKIPADPEQPIEAPQDVRVSNVVTVGNRTTSYWIPRHETVDLLTRACEEQAKTLTNGGSITVLSNKVVSTVQADQKSDLLTVQCQDGTSISATLVVAADGIDSTVRSVLADKSKKHWLQSKASKFRVRRYKSPATGLKIKALQFPPNFTLTNTTGEIIHSIPGQFYSFRGANTGSRDSANIGMLPLKRVGSARPGNLIGPPDHELWKLKTGAETKAWMAKCFPRVNWDEMVDDAEWERFVKARPTTFPYCQYSPGSSVTSPNGKTGIALVGDACHAFPPDIGQGINAGLMDVVALDRALKDNAKTDQSLSDALAAYEKDRGPEHRALIQLARCGAPYQYSQPWRRHRIGKWLWTANVGFRLLAHKLTAKLLAPPAIILMVRNPDMNYRTIMRRANATTAAFFTIFAFAAYKLILKKLVPLLG